MGEARGATHAGVEARCDLQQHCHPPQLSVHHPCPQQRALEPLQNTNDMRMSETVL